MPTYSYKCQNCEHELEVIRSMKDEPLIHCDECDKDELKQIITPAGGFRIYGRGVQRPTSRIKTNM